MFEKVKKDQQVWCFHQGGGLRLPATLCNRGQALSQAAKRILALLGSEVFMHMVVQDDLKRQGLHGQKAVLGIIPELVNAPTKSLPGQLVKAADCS